jgi:tyrosine-protein kinase Etk/Wzc
MDNQELINNETNRFFGIKFIDYIRNYLFHWKWFAISIILCLIIGKIKLMYTTPIYEATASILIKDQEKSASLNEMPAIQDLGLGTGGKSIDNEIEVLKSRTLMRRVVEKLDLNIQYFIKEGTLTLEKFKDQPINITFIDGKKSVYERNAAFIITPISKSKFLLKDVKEHVISTNTFGEPVKGNFGNYIITPKNSIVYYLHKDVKIVINKITDVANRYRNEVQVIPVNKLADAITLSLRDSNKDKAVTILNTLIKEHKLDEIEDKNEISKNTSNFIDSRLALISEELNEVEKDAQSFKTKNKLVNATTESEMFLELNADSERNFIQNSTQLSIMEYMLDYIKDHSNSIELLPSNLGVSDVSLNQMITSYNTIILERNRLVKNSSSKNPIVINLENQILSLQKTIKEGLINLRNSLFIQNKQLAKQERKLNSKIASVPKFEREFRNIQRQQQIKETLYLYLLQKKEESSISLAITTANSKLLDEAYAGDEPISPVGKFTYFAAFFLGLIFPVGLLFVKDLLDVKVRGKQDIETLNLPYLGDIPISDSKEKLVINKSARTSVAEAFRLLRTNINFISPSKNKGNTIFVTSTISNEGKSFIALNLASVLGYSGKKVLLIGLDLRAPKILEYLELNNNLGVTSFIIDDNLMIEDITINLREIENLDIIPSGPIPPNPAELLMSDRLKVLFEQAKEKYDYIIADTAPVGMVADTLLLNDFADVFVYVSRANYLDKRLLNIPYSLYKDKKLKNMAMLINCSDNNRNLGYGYGYGYGYGFSIDEIKIKWYKKILREKK